MSTLELSARVESRTVSHSRIGVFQNGGNAGVLTVESEHEQAVIDAINAGVNALAMRDLLKKCVDRFLAYEMDAETDPTWDHIAFMKHVRAAIRHNEPGDTEQL